MADPQTTVIPCSLVPAYPHSCLLGTRSTMCKVQSILLCSLLLCALLCSLLFYCYLLLPCSPAFCSSAPLLPCCPKPSFSVICSLLFYCYILLPCSPALCSPTPLLLLSPAPSFAVLRSLLFYCYVLLPCSPAPLLLCSPAPLLPCSPALCSSAPLNPPSLYSALRCSSSKLRSGGSGETAKDY